MESLLFSMLVVSDEILLVFFEIKFLLKTKGIVDNVIESVMFGNLITYFL